MLMPGALRHHGWKKVPVRIWFQDRALRAAQCLHAKSDQEYRQIRAFGLRNPVAVIPNPIAPPPVGGSVVSAPWSKSPNRRTVLFLGRLHPVKGLARLVQAWAEVQRFAVRGQWSSGPTHETWQLILAGPDEGGHREEIESLVAECGCRDSVVFPGELDEKQKWGALAAADLFVMPSDFENFGNAIVEAMSCAVPVITTTGTPWEELRRAGAGWWVAPRVESLAKALREALAMSETQRQEMGKRAAGLAARFSPQQAGADLIQVYRWLMDEIPRPPCVRGD
jgi:glycosyltransferase involved in cell wall biosynthesis